MTTAISIKGVTKDFDVVRALDAVSFEVPSHSIFGLLGPNGAGKTTLFSIIANFLKPDQGAIEVLDTDVRQISRLQGRMTILPHDALFQRNVPILDQLAFFRRLDGQTKQVAENEVKATLELVGLGDYMHRRVHALSHGMIKRLGLAQAFLGEPEVILLDEPTSGLDPQNARHIRGLVRQLQKKNTTVVISSHNLAEIQELCDHVAILDVGKVVRIGSMDELTRTGFQIDFTLARDLTEEEIGKLNALTGVTGVQEKGRHKYTASLDLTGTEGDTVTASFLRALLDMGITPRQFSEGSSLEEVFLKVTGKGGD
ncbi:MAG: ABC transporter ATP-binding protein [Planctomycetota bacterium]|nr:ABC transporter ATP-binding protein [Planctomycetota bacterium]